MESDQGTDPDSGDQGDKYVPPWFSRGKVKVPREEEKEEEEEEMADVYVIPPMKKKESDKPVFEKHYPPHIPPIHELDPQKHVGGSTGIFIKGDNLTASVGGSTEITITRGKDGIETEKFTDLKMASQDDGKVKSETFLEVKAENVLAVSLDGNIVSNTDMKVMQRISPNGNSSVTIPADTDLTKNIEENVACTPSIDNQKESDLVKPPHIDNSTERIPVKQFSKMFEELSKCESLEKKPPKPPPKKVIRDWTPSPEKEILSRTPSPGKGNRKLVETSSQETFPEMSLNGDSLNIQRCEKEVMVSKAQDTDGRLETSASECGLDVHKVEDIGHREAHRGVSYTAGLSPQDPAQNTTPTRMEQEHSETFQGQHPHEQYEDQQQQGEPYKGYPQQSGPFPGYPQHHEQFQVHPQHGEQFQGQPLQGQQFQDHLRSDEQFQSHLQHDEQFQGQPQSGEQLQGHFQHGEQFHGQEHFPPQQNPLQYWPGGQVYPGQQEGVHPHGHQMVWDQQWYGQLFYPQQEGYNQGQGQWGGGPYVPFVPQTASPVGHQGQAGQPETQEPGVNEPSGGTGPSQGPQRHQATGSPKGAQPPKQKPSKKGM